MRWRRDSSRPRGVKRKVSCGTCCATGPRLAGLVRAGAYRLAGADALGVRHRSVYGSNVSRFLADNDEPDQLDLSLYGTLAAALTPGTYVSGEAASVSPLRGALYRTMYLPPNNDTSATFLETLRLLLVHEVRRHPKVCRAGSSSPSRRRADGSRVASRSSSARRRPASVRFSYSLTRTGAAVRVVVRPAGITAAEIAQASSPPTWFDPCARPLREAGTDRAQCPSRSGTVRDVSRLPVLLGRPHVGMGG